MRVPSASGDKSVPSDLTMAPWEVGEDRKYSWLYARGYGDGGPMKLVAWRGLGHELVVLDAGCGIGTLAAMFPRYCGFDVAAESIRLARERHPSGEFHHLGITGAPAFFANRRFDLVICNDVLEHIPEDLVDEILGAMSRLPAPLHIYSISARPSRLLDEHGRGLHLTVRPREWWLERLSRSFECLDVSELDGQEAFYVALRPR